MFFNLQLKCLNYYIKLFLAINIFLKTVIEIQFRN